MPEMTLRFILPEEQYEMSIALKAGALHSVLTDLDEWLKQKLDSDGGDIIPTQEVRDYMWDLINDDGVGDLYE